MTDGLELVFMGPQLYGAIETYGHDVLLVARKVTAHDLTRMLCRVSNHHTAVTVNHSNNNNDSSYCLHL